ncbi:MAG: hypothetical protein IJV95_00525 [Clostridia bacterium]|nr:hypothetical protein [Clostridia bacterium]
MKSKKLFVLISLVCILVVSTVCAIIGFADDDYTFDEVQLSNEFYAGDTFTVPNVKVSNGEKSFDTEFSLQFPDGKSYTDDDSNPLTVSEYKLNMAGVYRLIYSAIVDGKRLSKEIKFTVKSKLYSTDGNKSIMEYGQASYKNIYDDDSQTRTGLKLSLAAGEEFSYNELVDLREGDAMRSLITFYALPTVDRQLDASGITLVLTDAYDSSNTVEIKIKAVELPINQMAESHWNWTYLSACAPSVGQVTTGYAKGNPIEVQVDTIYGTGVQFSFYGSNFYKTSNPINWGMTVYYNLEEKAVYVGPNKVVDLDDPFFFGTKLWGGFTTGEVFFGIKGNTFYKDYINLLITEICGKDPSGENILVKDSVPEMNIDFNAMDKDNLWTVLGQKFPVFNATAVDVYDGPLSVTVKAFNGYYSSVKTELDIVDGYFIADKLGVVTLEYSVTAHDGTKHVKLIDIPVKAEKTISVELSNDYTDSGIAGDIVKIADYSVSGSVGKAEESVTVTKNGKEYLVTDGTFTADDQGSYTVKISAVDKIGQTDEQSYTVEISKNDNPVFYGDVIVPKYMVVGKSYTLPEYVAYDFSASTGTAIDSVVKVNGTVGNVYTPTTAGDITIEYVATTANGQTVKTYLAKAIDATKTAVNGDKVMDAIKYFDQTGFTTSANSSGVNFTTTESASATFINYLSSYDFVLDFVISPNKKAFTKLEFTLTDVLVKDNVLTIAVYANDGKVTVNGADTGIKISLEALFDTTGRTSASIAFDARTEKLIAGANAYTVDGFIPFTDDIAIFAVKMDGVTAESEFSIRKICNQVLRSTPRTDNIDPMLSYNCTYGLYMEKNSVLTIFRAVVCDVLSPLKTNCLSVYNPDGSIATAIDGTKLDKVLSNKDYQITLNSYGTYVIDYTVIDDANNAPSYKVNIQVVDNEPPVIRVKDTFPKTAKVGDVIRIPDYQVTDDVDKDLSVTIILYNDFDGLRRIWTDKYFVINEVADYSITYISYDTAGNAASVTVTIHVEG